MSDTMQMKSPPAHLIRGWIRPLRGSIEGKKTVGSKFRIQLWALIGFVGAGAQALAQENLEKSLFDTPSVQRFALSIGPGFPRWATLEAGVSPDWFLFADFVPRPTGDHVLQTCVGGLGLREEIVDGLFIDLGSGAGAASSQGGPGSTIAWNFLLSFQTALGLRLDDHVEFATSVLVGVVSNAPGNSPGPVLFNEIFVGFTVRL